MPYHLSAFLQKMRMQSAKLRRNAAAAAWITLQMLNCKIIADLNVYTYTFFMLSRLLALSLKLYVQLSHTVRSL